MGTDLGEFIRQAKRVRDYGIRSGALPSDELIDALVPFDADPDDRTPEKVAKLRRAARKAYATMDEVTLDAVLHGEDPTRRRPPDLRPMYRRALAQLARPYNIVVTIGFVILLLAFHYTNWTSRAETTLRTIGEVRQLDYFSEIRRMVEIGLQLDEVHRTNEASQVLPNVFSTEVATFLNSAERLQAFQVTHRKALTDAAELSDLYYPLVGARAFAEEIFRSRAYPSVAPPPVETAPVETAPVEIAPVETAPADGDDAPGGRGEASAATPAPGGPTVPASGSVAPDDKEAALFNAAVESEEPVADWAERCRTRSSDLFNVFAHYRCYVESEYYINDAIGVDMSMTGFTLENALLEQHRDELRLKATTANRWILPAIYGALGAAVYSVVRYINVFLADPPLRTSLLRIAFGGFTGITISMLFGPSSAISFGHFEISTTLFLVCFLFGYSLDSFLALLRRADSYLNSAISGPGR